MLLFVAACTKQETTEPTPIKPTTIDYSELGVWRYDIKVKKESYTFYITKDSIGVAHIYPNQDSFYLIYAYTVVHPDTVLNHTSKTKHYLKAINDTVLYYSNDKCYRVK